MLRLPHEPSLKADRRRCKASLPRRLLAALALSLLAFDASAACSSSTNQTLQPPKLTHAGAADLPAGTPLDGGWSQAAAVGVLSGCSPIALKGTLAPASAAIAGITYQEGGKSYPIYATSVAGIGYVVGVQDGVATEWLPLAADTQTYPMAGTGTAGSAQIGTRARVRFVASGQLKPGNYAIATQTVATFSAFDASGGLLGKYTIGLASTAAELLTKTCAVLNPSTTVVLPAVSQSALTGRQANAGSTPFSIALRCQKGSRLYMVMTDANYPDKNLNLLFPKGGIYGLASVKIERGDGRRVAFGPDSSAPGTTNQWLVGDTEDGVMNIPFLATYQTYSSSDTAVFPAGRLQVAATFTLSYQ